MSENTQVILFTSCKGGVGKSTVCANLAMSLALQGKRVLMVDCDFGNRCLDIVLGLSDRVLYDISDVVLGRVDFSRAVIPDRRTPNLFFISAPFGFENNMRISAFKAVFSKLISDENFDYIFIDTPGGVGEPLIFAASVADTAYIIVSPTVASVRAADRTASYLYDRGIKRQRLIVNKVYGKSVKKAQKDIISIIDGTAVKLIGAIPYDTELISAGNSGILVDELYSTNVTRAFYNIALRTSGIPCPLFNRIRKLKTIK